MPERVVRDGEARRSADPPAAAGLRRPVVAGVVGKAAEAVTLVLLATVVPRLLGPADYGRLSVVLTLVAVGSVALTLGGATLLSRYVPAAPAQGRAALARALTLRLARNRIAPFALLATVAAVLAAAGRVPPSAAAWVLLALALNVAATLALQADLGLGRAAAWSARYPVQNAVLDRGGGGALRHGRGERRGRRGRRRGRRGARARPDGHGVALARGTRRTGAPADRCRPVRADGGGDRGADAARAARRRAGGGPAEHATRRPATPPSRSGWRWRRRTRSRRSSSSLCPP